LPCLQAAFLTNSGGDDWAFVISFQSVPFLFEFRYPAGAPLLGVQGQLAAVYRKHFPRQQSQFGAFE